MTSLRQCNTVLRVRRHGSRRIYVQYLLSPGTGLAEVDRSFVTVDYSSFGLRAMLPELSSRCPF